MKYDLECVENLIEASVRKYAKDYIGNYITEFDLVNYERCIYFVLECLEKVAGDSAMYSIRDAIMDDIWMILRG